MGLAQKSANAVKITSDHKLKCSPMYSKMFAWKFYIY